MASVWRSRCGVVQAMMARLREDLTEFRKAELAGGMSKELKGLSASELDAMIAQGPSGFGKATGFVEALLGTLQGMADRDQAAATPQEAGIACRCPICR